MYDIFLKNSHSEKIQKVQRRSSDNLLNIILKHTSIHPLNIKLLEIGPGKGYFKCACDKKKIDYYALDRNRLILDQLSLSSDHAFIGEVPACLYSIKQHFDIIVCAFVAEHLRSGAEVYDFVKSLKNLCNEGGMIVLLTPDALKQKFEFWNIDYTHIYPTTRRNIYQVFLDNEILNMKILPINGIYISNFVESKFVYWVFRLLINLYSYRLLAVIAYPFYRIPIYDLNNVFYRAYCFLKEENLLFIAKP